ncbi:hypothetical protein Csa_012938 [Cucumis sativus]|uniref:Uncharacterized protein n=1 Tax=Cucumis sativus TaxID=3659 RepID=A0A0A0L2R0_CUCSA|nr:hypothetical protein Csa_012938 [Cucumis sativus]
MHVWYYMIVNLTQLQGALEETKSWGGEHQQLVQLRGYKLPSFGPTSAHSSRSLPYTTLIIVHETDV